MRRLALLGRAGRRALRRAGELNVSAHFVVDRDRSVAITSRASRPATLKLESDSTSFVGDSVVRGLVDRALDAP